MSCICTQAEINYYNHHKDKIENHRNKYLAIEFDKACNSEATGDTFTHYE